MVDVSLYHAFSKACDGRAALISALERLRQHIDALETQHLTHALRDKQSAAFLAELESLLAEQLAQAQIFDEVMAAVQAVDRSPRFDLEEVIGEAIRDVLPQEAEQVVEQMATRLAERLRALLRGLDEAMSPPAAVHYLP